MSTTNLPTFSLNPAAVSARAAEVPDADFSGGMNKGSCNHGLGINTGDFDPKATDFSRIADTAPHETMHIGGDGLDDGGITGFDINTVNGVDVNNEVAFVLTVAPVAADAVLDATTGAVNRTGATVPSGSWLWGEIPVAQFKQVEIF